VSVSENTQNAKGIGKASRAPPDNYARRTLLGVAVWTALVGLSLGVNQREHADDAELHARIVANAYIDKDLAVRSWITGHGGVYVKPDERTPPNRWLTVPERDVVTTTGQALTLVNPAYATRQLMEEFAAATGIRGHLTSTHLKNPSNAPDAWEKSALDSLERGGREVVAVVDRDGAQVLRLMRPVYMEKGCMKCHADMDIPVGGLRGGISTAVPLEPFLASQQDAVRKLAATHGLIWLVGLATLGVAHARNRERRRERTRLELAGRHEEQRIAGVLALSERMEELDQRALMQEGLELAARLTDSAIGYFHLVNDDQDSIELVTWTRATLKECQAAYDTHYPLGKAGVWADSARHREPVVHNDYPNLTVRNGLPDGHAPLHRHASVPVVEGGLVRVIMGVGNKAENYDDDDVRILQLLANDIWKLVQRKRAGTDLRDRERLLREAQEVARMGSWSFDHHSREFAWSPGMYSIFEVDAKDFRPTLASIAALIHPDDRTDEAAAFEAAAVAQRDYEKVLRLQLADGRTKFVRLSGQTQCAPDGQPQRTVGTAQDVTEHRELELLRRSESNLAALFENTDRLIWSVDTQMHLVVNNSLFDEMIRAYIGRSPTPGEVMPPRELPEEFAQAWRERYRRALAGETFSVETETPATGGEVRWIAFSFYPILDDRGHPVGVTVFGQDFTERRKAEQQRQESMERMSHLVSELEANHRKNTQINRLNDLLQSCRYESEAHEVIRLSLAEIFEGLHGSLALTTHRNGALETVAGWGSSAHMTPLFQMDDCWALRRGEIHEVHDATGLMCTHFDETPRHGYLCLPLIVKGEVLGMMHLAYPDGCNEACQFQTRELARSVGETIKLSLSNLRLREALHEQATHDALTGLFNRRYSTRPCRANCTASIAAAASSPSPCSTSTISSASTTPWATKPATMCCARWAASCARTCARATSAAATAARNSSSSCPTPAPKTRKSGSPTCATSSAPCMSSFAARCCRP
jgi:PAS domain S-box-containing protein